MLPPHPDRVFNSFLHAPLHSHRVLNGVPHALPPHTDRFFSHVPHALSHVDRVYSGVLHAPQTIYIRYTLVIPHIPRKGTQKCSKSVCSPLCIGQLALYYIVPLYLDWGSINVLHAPPCIKKGFSVVSFMLPRLAILGIPHIPGKGIQSVLNACSSLQIGSLTLSCMYQTQRANIQ